MSETEKKFEAFKASCATYKGHVTRQLNLCKPACASAEDNPSMVLYEDLKKHKNVLQEAYEKAEQSIQSIERGFKQEGPAKEYVDKSFKEISDTLSEGMEALNRAFNTLERALRIGIYAERRHVLEQAENEVVIRADTTLKPPKLTSDFTPVEFSAWLKQFKAFFEQSNFDKAEKDAQHQYVLSFLDASIRQRIERRILPTTDVLDVSDGVFGLLVGDFKLRYPIFNRRVDFFRTKQDQNESPTTFFARLQKVADEAELAGISPEELMCHQIIQGLQDKTLRDKLLNLSEKVLPNFENEMRTYEAAGASAKRLDKMLSKNNTSGTRNRHKHQNRKKRSNSNARGISKLQKMKKDGRCTRCGSKSHERDNCKIPPDIVCHGCNRKGHIKPACCSDNRNKGNGSRSNSRNASRATSRNNSRENSRESSPEDSRENKNASVRNRDN